MSDTAGTVDVLQTMDADVWATEFMRLFGGRKQDIDKGLMLTWFACAIMCGFNEATRRSEANRDAIAAQATDWERKARELCMAHGNLLIEHHDLGKQARELAQVLHQAQIALDELLGDLDDGIRQELGTGGVSGATLVRARQAAQAVLDAQGRPE